MNSSQRAKDGKETPVSPHPGMMPRISHRTALNNDVSRWMQGQNTASTRLLPADVVRQIQQNHPDMCRLVATLGMDLQRAVTLWLGNASPRTISCLSSYRPTATEVCLSWVEILERPARAASHLIELLLTEHHLSENCTSLGKELPSRFRVEKTLTVCRQRTAIALHDWAREVNWNRPIIFIRCLKMARVYFEDLALQQSAATAANSKEISGRLGVACILISRFEMVKEKQLLSAHDSLLLSVEQGNDPRYALPYIGEALLRLYDATGNVDYLHSLRGLQNSAGANHLACDLTQAEGYLRLFDHASRRASATACLDMARKWLQKNRGSRTHEEEVRRSMLFCLLETAEARLAKGHKLNARGVSFPFGIRKSGSINESLLLEVSPKLLKALNWRNEDGDPLTRTVSADICSFLARSSNHEGSAADYLKQAHGLRNGWRNEKRMVSALDDERSRLSGANDELLLAEVLADGAKRRSALEQLLREAMHSHESAFALTAIATDLERNGPFVVRNLVSGEVLNEEWVKAIGAGDSAGILAEAAKRAVASHDLRRRDLGGRSNVVTVEDHLGVTDRIFVFKPTSLINWRREVDRSERIHNEIIKRGLASTFKLIEHICVAANNEELHKSNNEIVSVRRYNRARILDDFLREAGEQAINTMFRTAQYLALIQAIELPLAFPARTRSDLKSKELGRWLRGSLKISNDAAVFEAWWNCVASVPALPRRDAHAQNWLVDESGAVVAIDLEATGFRPLGYELAQLTDDRPIYSSEAWAVRKQIFDAYLEELEIQGIQVDHHAAWLAYRAGVLARAVRAITDPTSDGDVVVHGRNLLKHFARGSEPDPLTYVAGQVLDAWNLRLGLKATDSPHLMSEADRIRLSRSISYHLRHDDSLALEEGGWVGVGVLVIHMNASGTRTTESAIFAVAQAATEERFQVSGSRIRAFYGHSLAVEMNYVPATCDVPLYHATPSAGLDKLIYGGQGLTPQRRQWVHLTTDPVRALRAGRRHGHSVLLRVDPGELKTLVNAAGVTWLAKEVPLASMHVVPLHAHP